MVFLVFQPLILAEADIPPPILPSGYFYPILVCYWMPSGITLRLYLSGQSRVTRDHYLGTHTANWIERSQTRIVSKLDHNIWLSDKPIGKKRAKRSKAKWKLTILSLPYWVPWDMAYRIPGNPGSIILIRAWLDEVCVMDYISTFSSIYFVV